MDGMVWLTKNDLYCLHSGHNCLLNMAVVADINVFVFINKSDVEFATMCHLGGEHCVVNPWWMLFFFSILYNWSLSTCYVCFSFGVLFLKTVVTNCSTMHQNGSHFVGLKFELKIEQHWRKRMCYDEQKLTYDVSVVPELSEVWFCISGMNGVVSVQDCFIGEVGDQMWNFRMCNPFLCLIWWK